MVRHERGDPNLPPGPARDLARLFQGLHVASKMKLSQVASKAKLGPPYVGEVVKGWKVPSPDAAVRIARALRADDAAARRAYRLAVRIHEIRQDARSGQSRGDPFTSGATALLYAWDALETGAARRSLAPGNPVRQALEVALARAITRYATHDGRLDIARPLLTTPALLAEPAVAAEFAKVLAGRGTPAAKPIGHRWRAALTDPTHARDFTVEAAALLELFQAQVASGELEPWLRDAVETQTIDNLPLEASVAVARRELAEITELAGKVTVGALGSGLRMRLYDQTSVIAEHVSGFVGRQAILGRINEVIETRDSAYCHVLAHPGVGKTALMAMLIRGGDYIHHFNIRTLGVVSPEAFLGNICARLIARYQAERPPRQDAFSNGSYLSELLADIAGRRGRDKIVIVVDALDESDTSAQLPGSNPLFLPDWLPSGVIFVVASRPENETRPIGEWHPSKIRAEGDQVVIPIDHLGDDNMNDIRTYLEPWPVKDGVARYMERFGYDARRFTEELARRSEGNFMYLHHMLPAIDRGEFDDREPAYLPLGLRQYYTNHLERMREENTDLWYRHRLPVIATFVRAGSRPLTVAEIAELSDIGSETIVKDTLRRWSAFVVAEPVPREDGTRTLAYRIYHASFAEFLGAST